MSESVIIKHGDKTVTPGSGAIADPNLSWKATSLHAVLLTFSDGHKLDPRNLEKLKRDGREATRTGIAELQRHGYISVERTRGADGRFSATIWTIYNSPTGIQRTEREPESEMPCRVEPIPAQSLAGSPSTEVRQIKDKKEEKDISIKETTTTTTNHKAPRELVYPRNLGAPDRAGIAPLLVGLDAHVSQQILDELAGAMLLVGRIKGSPIEYFAGILKRANEGSFEPRLGIPVAKQRSLDIQKELEKLDARRHRESAPLSTEERQRIIRENAAKAGINLPGK